MKRKFKGRHSWFCDKPLGGKLLPEIHSARSPVSAMAWLVLAYASSACSGDDRRLAALESRVDSMAVAISALGRAAGLREGGGPGFAPAMAKLEGLVRRGDSTAPIVLIEYTDYLCPFCATFTLSTGPDIDAEFVNTGTVEHWVRNYPLVQIHPLAPQLGAWVECAAEVAQERAWRLRRAFFARQQGLDSARAHNVVDSIVGTGSAADCQRGSAAWDRMETDLTEAKRLSLRATPAFLLGKRVGSDSVDGVLFTGAAGIEAFRMIVDSLLKSNRAGVR